MLLRGELVATLTMVLGSGGVFSLLVGLNQGGPQAAAAEPRASIAVDAAPKPPSPKERARPRRRRARKASPTAHAPSPQLGAALGGLDLGLATPSMEEMSQGLLGQAQDVVMTPDTVDAPPRPIEQVQPEYPARARQRNIEGYVTLSLRVGLDGGVEEVRVLRGEPAGVFDTAAQEAVLCWRFSPATYEGVPVSTRMQQTLHFRLR